MILFKNTVVVVVGRHTVFAGLVSADVSEVWKMVEIQLLNATHLTHTDVFSFLHKHVSDVLMPY